jgi:hypothetical protein
VPNTPSKAILLGDKVTQKERAKIWYQKHKALTIERARLWDKENHDRRLQTARKRYTEDLEKSRQGNRERMALWRARNPERALEIDRESKARRKANKVTAAKIQETRRKWRENNPDYNRNYREMHLEAVKENVRKYQEAHPHYARDYCRRNPERTKARNQRRRALKKGNGGSFTAEQWSALKSLYNHQCVCCHRSERELKVLGLALVPDHVVPLIHGGLNVIANIQPLCHAWSLGSKGGCNNRKGSKSIDFRRVAVQGA